MADVARAAAVVPDVGAPIERRRRQIPWFVRDFVRAAFAGLALGTVGTLVARWTFFGDVIGSFRWQSGWCGVAITVALALCRMRVLAVLAAIASVYLLAPVVGPSLSSRDTVVTGDTFRVETANYFFGNNAVDELRVWIRHDPPDVLAVQELSHSWIEDLEDLSGVYPTQLVYPETLREWHDVGFGIALFTRLPVVSSRVVWLRPDCLPMLEMVVRVGDHEVTVRTMHPPSPQILREWELRNEMLASAGRDLEWGPDCVLMADFNTSSGSPFFSDILASTGLRDSRRGWGRLPTWKTAWPIRGLWVDIDHILVGSSVSVLERDTAVIPGSDHIAARATLVIPKR